MNEQLLELFSWEEPSEVWDVLYDRASEEVELGLSVRETVDEVGNFVELRELAAITIGTYEPFADEIRFAYGVP